MTTLFTFLHVACLFLFVAMVQRALAAPGARRGKPLIILIVVGVFGMLFGFAVAGVSETVDAASGWIAVKALAWAGILHMPFLVRKKPEKAMTFTLITIALVVLALYMVYYKPF